jgi:hypothetical protein
VGHMRRMQGLPPFCYNASMPPTCTVDDRVCFRCEHPSPSVSTASVASRMSQMQQRLAEKAKADLQQPQQTM